MLVGLFRWIHLASGHRCVLGLVCDGFSEAQRETLLTPSYKIRKERKASTLVSPKDVTVISTIDLEGQASPQSTVQPSVHAPAPSASQSVSFVTSAQVEAMNDKRTEQFAQFEALLPRENVFSMPKTAVPAVSHPVLPDKLFSIPLPGLPVR